MKRHVAGHPLEYVLLSVCLIVLGWTMLATISVALDEGVHVEDLTFAGTTRELSLLLQARGRDQLARLERIDLPPKKELAVDRIVLLADPTVEPGVAKGGFIADHVALYNDHMIRRAVAQTETYDGRPSQEDVNPSLFRTTLTGEGEQRLSDRPNPRLLTVQSPHAERRWTNVHTSDWRSGGTLLGLSGEVAIATGVTDRSRAYLNGSECTVATESARVLLYCASRLASDVKRFFDVGFELDLADTTFEPRAALTYRADTFWRNGQQVTSRSAAIKPGDVLDVPRTGPFLLSRAERGTLATSQWINGRHTFVNQQLGTISFFGAAGRSPVSDPAKPLVLTLDAALSEALEIEARRFFRQKSALTRMSLIVMDLRTGAVRAIVEPSRRGGSEPLLAFEPILVGSVVKPIVSAALLARRPELQVLTLNYAGDVVGTVGSVRLQRPFANAANGCTGTIAFADFIRCSSNHYAAELLVRSLQADGFRATEDSQIPRDVLERSALGAGLAEVFDVDAFGHRTAGRNAASWGEAIRASAEPTPVGSRVLYPWEPRPWIVFPKDEGTPLDWAARYAFGGWENRWTILSVAEAYARIARGREVRARFLSPTELLVTDQDAVAFPQNVQSALEVVRAALTRVGVDGTAAGLSQSLGRSLPEEAVVLAKTGTLNEQTDRFKALAIAVGMPATAQRTTALQCGLVVVSYFEFDREPRARKPQLSLPPVHLEFARDGLTSVLQQHWTRLSGCGTNNR